MVSTVNAISKILVVLKLTACFPFYSHVSEYRVKKSNSNYKVYSLIMFLFTQSTSVFLLYAAVVDYPRYYPWRGSPSEEHTNQVFESILCISVYSLMQILCFINYSRFIAIINAILEIDCELKRKFRREVDNSKLEAFNTAALIYIVAHLTLILITFSTKFYHDKHNFIILAYLFQLTMSAAYVVFFTSLVKLTVERLKVVNSLFQSVATKSDEDLKSFFQVVEVYKLVEKTFGVVDDCNGLILLFYLAYVFYTLTNEIYCLAFMILRNEAELLFYIDSTGWILHQLWILWELSMTCGVVPSEGKRTAQILSRIYGKGKDYQNMIDKFLTKSIKQEIKFTAYGFFVIDNSTLFKIISAVTTYLVILIQFKQLEESKETSG